MPTLLNTTINNQLSKYMFTTALSLYTLPESILQSLLLQAKTISIKRKTVLFHEGEPPKGVYAIRKGKIKSSQLNVDGGLQILYIHRDGEFIGYRSILGNEKQPVTMTALEDSELYFIEKDLFADVLRDNHQLCHIMLKCMSHEFTAMANRINVFAQKGIKERLALFLLVLNETYKKENSVTPSEIHMNRNDLAAYTGTSVENLVRMLKTFKESGYVRVEGKSIFIENFEALNIIAGQN